MRRAVVMLLAALLALCISAVLFAAEFKIRHSATVYSDARDVGLRKPEGVSCSGSSTALFVADTGNARIVRYALQDGVVGDGREIKVPEIPFPVQVQADSKEVIFALDGRKRRIAVIGPDGLFRKYLEPVGVPQPAAIVLKSFRVGKDGNIYLLDISAGRMLVLDPDGKYLRHVPFPEKYGFIEDLSVDSGGNVLLLDSVSSTVYGAGRDAKEFTPIAKDMKEYMNFPTSIATDGRGRIFLVDQNGAAVVVLGKDGSFLGRQLGFGWKDGLLRYPSQVCISGRGDIVVADRENSRVQMFTLVE